MLFSSVHKVKILFKIYNENLQIFGGYKQNQSNAEAVKSRLRMFIKNTFARNNFTEGLAVQLQVVCNFGVEISCCCCRTNEK